jgi:adenine-specific DNA methylase
VRSLVIATRSSLAAALRIIPDPKRKRVRFSVLRKQGGKWIDPADLSATIKPSDLEGTVKRGSVTCPCCDYTTSVDRIRIQLKSRRGGADDAQLMCVFTSSGDGSLGVRQALATDISAVEKASSYAASQQEASTGILSFIPDELISLDEIRRISVPIYGMVTWGDLYTRRQAVAIATLCRIIREDLPASMKAEPVTGLDFLYQGI